MPLIFDPEIAGRRAISEPIIGAASTAQPIPRKPTGGLEPRPHHYEGFRGVLGGGFGGSSCRK
jgi:hypothetical protein